MIVDTKPLLRAASEVMTAGMNNLSPTAKKVLADALVEGSRLELRIAIVDGEPAVGMWLANDDGIAKELGRLGNEIH